MASAGAARRYARALFSLAQKGKSVEDVRRELDALSQLFEQSAELRFAVLQPLHPSAQRRAALWSLCERLGTSDLVRRFCALLVDRRRVIEFEAIRKAYAELADAAAGRLRARVVAARPLSDAQKERLRRALSRHTGREVDLELDEAGGAGQRLLGGAVARVGGIVFDGSLRTQLEQLRSTLTRGH
jgi:F-type H+-transporting ATPase subunit delta